MKLATITSIMAIAFVFGCNGTPLETYDVIRQPSSPVKIVNDAGPEEDAASIDTVAEAGTTEEQSECTTACDCFDDNVCTEDECVDGKCHNNPTDGDCGYTIGWCVGSSCCTSEYTCFMAYDNSGNCP